jgi:hypothetical protein
MNAHIAAQMRIRIHNITAAGEVDRQFLCIHAFSALPWGLCLWRRPTAASIMAQGCMCILQPITKHHI